MTFQYFLGALIFTMVASFLIMVITDNLVGLIAKPPGWRYLKVWFKQTE